MASIMQMQGHQELIHSSDQRDKLIGLGFCESHQTIFEKQNIKKYF